MTAYAHEIELARHDGVRFVYQAQPLAIVGDGRVEGLRVVRMEPDPEARHAYRPVGGSETVIGADAIIKATGQTAHLELLAAIPGLALDGGRPVHDPITMRTGNPRYFTGGDAANGGKEVVNAVAEGKRAAHGINETLRKANG